MSAFVFLHGFTGDPSTWDEVISLLGPARAAALRLFGHGAEGVREADRSFVEEVDRLAALVRSEALAGAHLVGYSLGARIALGLLVRHPGLFSRATLIGANPGISGENARFERALSDEAWVQLLEREGLDRFVEAWEAQPLFATQAELPEEVRRRERARRAGHTPQGLARSLRLHGLAQMPDWRPQLKDVSVPVTLVAGARDAKFQQLAREMRALIPDARLHLVEGAGHNVVLERPHAVASLLERANA